MMVEVAQTDLEHSGNRVVASRNAGATPVGERLTPAPTAGDTGSLGVVAPTTVPRRWGPAAASNVLLALGLVAALAITWKNSTPVSQLVAPQEEITKVGFGAYVHAQAGEVLVLGPGGLSVAPSPGGAGRALGAEERVATLASGQATLHLGAATVVVLSPNSELRLRKNEGETQVCELLSGTAQFTMTRQQATPLRVQVPGGELRSSNSVSVIEGTVEIALDGQPPILLGNGDRWPAHAGSATSGVASAPALPAPSTPLAAVPRWRSEKTTVPASAVIASPSSQLAAQNNLLAEALEAGKRGDVDAQAQTLDLFLSRYPQSPNAHDAVIARMRLAKRAGDPGTAAREAGRYLQAFPSGPLRDEALATLAHSQPAAPSPAGSVSPHPPFPKGT
jgi:ferric-dicitrate binding protein FerR (iron transport regulator)